MRQWGISAGIIAAVVAATAVGTSGIAFAKCNRLACSVNDFDRKDPTGQSQRCAVDYVKRWASQQGISHYRIGKPSTTCRHSIHIPVLGQESTCDSAVSVCW